MRTAIRGSSTPSPFIRLSAVVEQPSAVILLEVRGIRQSSGSLDSSELLIQNFAGAFAARSAEEEDIGSRLFKPRQRNLLSLGRTGELLVGRSEVTFGLNDIAILPCASLISLPNCVCRGAGDISNYQAVCLLASRDLSDLEVRDMEVIVSVRFCGLTIESNLDGLICVSRKVILSELSIHFNCVIRVAVSTIRPSQNRVPVLTTVIGDEDDELIIILLARRNRCRSRTDSFGEREIEGQLIAILNDDSRANDPVFAVSAGDIKAQVTVSRGEYAVCRSHIPSGSNGYHRRAALLVFQKHLIAFPLTRQGGSVEGLHKRNARSGLDSNRLTIIRKIGHGANSCYANVIVGERL